MKKFQLSILLLLLSLLILPTTSRALELGKAPPDFTLKTLDGKEVRLSDFKGRVIVLKLATTWCPTCQQQTGEFVQAGAFLNENNVQVIEVFLQDTPEMVKEFMKGKSEDVPLLPLIDDGTVHKRYNVYLIPRVLVIGPDFILRRDGSVISAYDLKLSIQALLDKKKS